RGQPLRSACSSAEPPEPGPHRRRLREATGEAGQLAANRIGEAAMREGGIEAGAIHRFIGNKDRPSLEKRRLRHERLHSLALVERRLPDLEHEVTRYEFQLGRRECRYQSCESRAEFLGTATGHTIVYGKAGALVFGKRSRETIEKPNEFRPSPGRHPSLSWH